ncbi:MAG: hypothetical protein KDD36_05590 [Flavobacteriales bacterium]|nr:hypothetical protein [Flavobacteriales bacterium]
MEESIKISKKLPELESMQYQALRDLGVEHVQNLSGKIWTDYNSHDPGVTILEVLSYAITDLGHRVNQDIRNIIAQDPSDPDKKDIQNFFTAAKILPNKALTIRDIRKIIMDVSVSDSSDDGCSFVGVKNAWVSVSPENEFPVHAHTVESILSYDPHPLHPGKPPLEIKPLYNVLLEFEKCDAYGDLNENELDGQMTVTGAVDDKLNGLVIKVEVEFPRWDEEGVDWNDPDSIRKSVQNINVQFFRKPRRYTFDYKVDNNKYVVLSGLKPGAPDPEEVLGMDMISDNLNAYIYNGPDSLIARYQAKVFKIFRILKAVKAKLHANRNLCEDFFKFNALKIEEIALCTDIELELEADVEEVQAQIYYHIGRFLSPTVPYYSLDEMLEMDIPVEKIYEGPLLEHGFLLDEDVDAADRRDVIHVSDLIQIIMDVEGVVAVKKIEIANLPQDNDDGIPSKSVKWCLDLAFEYNYIPRLSVTDSKITYYKDQLPYQADQTVVDTLVAELESGEQSQKIENPVLDLKVPRGNYLQLEEYTSIQEDFPLVYGIGDEGLPASAPVKQKAQVKQLKGFLMFFDQLLANYMSQLAHVKDLFSMNAEKDEDGNYVIGRTYFTQVLKDIVPESDGLYTDPDHHPETLAELAEDQHLFFERRNKFLNHLMARFSEQFTDYALMTYRLAGVDADRDLIQDKLTFLNAYPEISAARGTAFNYMDRCHIWHIDNKSGLEKRGALMVGVDERKASDLSFSAPFDIIAVGDQFRFEIGSAPYILQSPDGILFDTTDEAALAIEDVITHGQYVTNFVVKEEGPGAFSFALYCNEVLSAISKKVNYASEELAGQAITQLHADLANEIFFNPESNRNNLAAPVDNYFEVDIAVDMVPTIPEYTISYKLHSEAYSTDPGDVIMTGEQTGDGEEGMTLLEMENLAQERAVDFIWDVVANGDDPDQYSFLPDEAPFTSPYEFVLTSRLGGELGRSTAFDFNIPVADAFNALTTKQVSITGADTNNGDYTFTGATADGPYVELTMTAPMPAAGSDGELAYTDSLSFTADKPGNAFILSGDYTPILHDVADVLIMGSGFNNGLFNIRKVSLVSGDTVIEVKEELASTNSDGTLSFTKSFPVHLISGNKVTVLGGLDTKAVNDTVAFFKTKFYSNEGFHLVEHLLLRPRVNGWYFVPADEDTLASGLADKGLIFFERKLDIKSSVKSSKIFRVEGDWTAEIYAGLLVAVSGTHANDDTYTVNTATYDVGDDVTEIKVVQAFPETTTEPQGIVSYHVSSPVQAVITANRDVIVAGEIPVDAETVVHLTGSTDQRNDGTYKVESSEIQGGSTHIILASIESLVQDRLLPVNLDPDCIYCQLENPYTYIASVIMPYWQGRFRNADFRKFFERKIRLEAPAHIFLNICWVSNAHMSEFEEMYKRWLLEISKEDRDHVQLSIALSNLIDILTRLRNVYPVGHLHDCEEDNTTENSIILNNSILGNA